MRNIYPFGKAPFVILIIAIISGLTYGGMKWRRNSAERPELILVFQAEIHEELYKKAAEEFGKKHNCTVKLQRVQKEVLMDRLQSAMQTGCEVPDVVELLEGTIGYFTRGKLENVGLVDLTDRLRAEGFLDESKMVQKRYALWSSRGHIFAIPHDVHPAGLCYRADLVMRLRKELKERYNYDFDVTQLTTWDKFVDAGKVISGRHPDHPEIPGEWEFTDESLGIRKGAKRYMIDMADDSMISLIILMTQRGFDLFDANGNVAFDRPEVAELIAWFVHQTRGIDRIAFPAGDGQNFYQAMKEGLDLFYFTPDWRTMQFTFDLAFQDEDPNKTPSILKGQLALMKMPVWADKDGNRLTFVDGDGKVQESFQTGTWGGSGLAITKHCKDQNLAWEFAKYLYLEASDEDFLNRFQKTNIVPPVKKAWTIRDVPVKDKDGKPVLDENGKPKLAGFFDKSPYFKEIVRSKETGDLEVVPISIGEFYASQADFTPPHFSTAYTSQAETQLLNVYYTARDFYETEIRKAGKNPSRETLKKIDDEMLALIKRKLTENSLYIKRLIDRNVFLKDGVVTADAKSSADAASPAETAAAPATEPEEKQEQ